MRKYIPILLLSGFLASCGSVNLDKPVDSSDFNQHLQTAQNFVNIAYAAMDTCALSGLSICSPSKIAQVKAVANEALAQAREVGASNATLGQTLLRVAMNAVLLFYNDK
jgi:hypothetical protein